MKSIIKNHSEASEHKSKSSITVLVFALISMFMISCGTSPTPTPTCNTSNTLFQQIYNNVATAAGNTNTITFDNDVHQYNFTVSTNKVICSVGYQSQPAVASQIYKIQIIDFTPGSTAILATVNSTFSSTTTSYASVPNIIVVPGHTYAIRRTLTNDLGYVVNTVGRMVTSTSNPTIPFPYTVGDLTITGSTLYQSGSTPTVFNFGLPFIDIVFQ